ncbi:unnamed protein product, partial [Rotaria sp. Silwood1]
MSARQPLLKASSRLSISDDGNDDNNGNKKQLFINSFSDWRRCFRRKKNNNKYIKLHNDVRPSDKDKPVGVLRLVVPIFAQSVNLFSFLVPFFQSFSQAQGAASEVFRLIDEGNNTSINEIDVWKKETESIYDIDGDIEFDNVNFIYPSREATPVLRNLSFIARAGQTTALVGSSGC